MTGSREKFTQLPTVIQSGLGDIIAAVQGGVTSQQTLQQVANLILSNTILYYDGNPTTHVAGRIYQLCWDRLNEEMYVCTLTGSELTAVWTLVAASASEITPPSRGGTGVSNPTARTLPVAQGSSDFSFIGPLTNGQLLIGSTGNNPVPSTITSGSGISITNSPGSIQVDATGLGSFAWNIVNSPTSMQPNNGYIIDAGIAMNVNLPLTFPVGSMFAVVGKSAGGWSINCNVGQSIIVGSQSTSSGGSIFSTNSRDSVWLVAVTEDSELQVLGAPQSSGLTYT